MSDNTTTDPRAGPSRADARAARRSRAHAAARSARGVRPRRPRRGRTPRRRRACGAAVPGAAARPRYDAAPAYGVRPRRTARPPAVRRQRPALRLRLPRTARPPPMARLRRTARTARQPKTNTLAIVSLIAVDRGVSCSCRSSARSSAVITGHISLSQIKQNGEGGRGHGLAGTILGWVGLGLVRARHHRPAGASSRSSSRTSAHADRLLTSRR